jgi:hypothetical protein
MRYVVCVALALFSLLLLQFARTPGAVGTFSHMMMEAVETKPVVDTTTKKRIDPPAPALPFVTQNNYQMDDKTHGAHDVVAVETNVASHTTNQNLTVMDYCDLIQFAVSGQLPWGNGWKIIQMCACFARNNLVMERLN